MQTDDLIRSLARDLAPVPAHTIHRRIALGIALGALAPAIAIILGLGVRADLADAARTLPFWAKFAYTLALGGGGILATFALSRPQALRLPAPWLLAVPVFAMAALAALEWARVPAGYWTELWFGRSELKCMSLIVLLAIPIFFGIAWAYRILAPGNLRLAGAMAGFASGACAATLYGLHCTESAIGFVFAWYTAGIILAMAGGLVAGPRLLRW